MPYVGRDPRRGNYLKLDDIQSSFNGSTKTFNLTSGGTAYYPDSTLSVLVSVGGTVLEPVTDYGITNNQIIFTNAPESSYNFFAIVQSLAVNIGVPGDGSVTGDKLSKPLWYDNYFKLDSNNDRVGIGVEHPDSLLHLKSAASPTIHLEDTSQTTKLKIYAQDSSTVVGTYTNHPLIFTTNSAAERLKISADGSQCTITSNAHDGGLEILAGNNSQETRIRLQGKAANGTAHEWYMGASRSADRFYVSNGTATRFAILDDGKTGIGIATPVTKLQIHGGDETLLISGDTAVGSAANTGGTIALGGIYHTDGSITGWSQIKGLKDNNTSNNFNGYLSFTTRDTTDGYVERLRITSAGKVGINTTVPTSSFEIHGGEDNPGISLKRNTGGGDVASISWHAQNASPSTVAKINYRGGAAPGGLQFYSGGGTSSELRMVINPSGLVGIGEDDPDGNKLLIRAASTVGTKNGHIMLTGDSATNGQGPQIVFSESGSGSSYAGAYIGHVRTTTNSVGDLVFGTRATGGDANTIPTERLRIDSSGRILYGTTSSTRETSLVLVGNSNSYTTNPGVIDLFVGNTPSNLGSMGQICFGTQNVVGARIDGRADQDWTVNSARGTHIRFLTCDNGTTQLDERLRITNAGIIQCGTSGVLKAEINNAVSGHQFISQCDDNQDGFEIYQQHGSTATRNTLAVYDNRGGSGAKQLAFGVRGDGKLTLHGRTFAMGTQSDSGASVGIIGNAWGNNEIGIKMSHKVTGGQSFFVFYNNNGQVGYIQSSGSGTIYNTGSDYRLKENQVLISDGITRLKQLKPYRFNFKKDPSTTLDGFFAHEVQSVVPEAIAGTKDEVATKDEGDRKIGDPILQGMDYGRITPLLTAALQEAIAEIETLKTKVAALEGS